MLCDVVDGIVGSIDKFFASVVSAIGVDALFFIALAVEALIVGFFLIKSLFSYETKLNRALEKLNFWLFERKVVTEDNIKELNFLFKTKAPKRLCYYWQQYILFREGTPSSYLSTENLVEKPLKTSSYNSNIKNLTIFSTLWAVISSVLTLIGIRNTYLSGQEVVVAVAIAIFVMIIAVAFIVYLRARKNSVLNSLYQNTQLFGRFMDNACIDLPSYIDYQILFTPQEIENGQPVLREFLDYKARKEKEEFNRAKIENVETETYDFASTGVDGSIVLDRAMKESELFLKKKEKTLLKISQLESMIETRRKNFDGVQKDFQTKIQASKENVDRLRQMQEETTNRIESNYYRKQQTQEIAKQEQLEQEFEQQRAKYMLEKNEGEEEIAKLNAELEAQKQAIEKAMISEYQSFFNKFCKSAEKVVAKVYGEKISALKAENEENKEYITELEIKLKNKPKTETEAEAGGGQYDENGNYVYENGTYYDKDGNFHDVNGNVYSQDGKLLSKAEQKHEEEKQVVDFGDFDAFEFMTDVSQKDDVFGVAENVLENLDDGFEVVNDAKQEVSEQIQPDDMNEKNEPAQEEQVLFDEEEVSSPVEKNLTDVATKRRGRPRKEDSQTISKPTKSVGRPRKIVDENQPKKSVGRPKKIVKAEPVTTEKRGRGRPKKSDSIEEINKKLAEEEARINQLRSSINNDLQTAINGMNANADANMTRREQLIKEIERLQVEAQQAISNNQPENKISEINSKLESLLNEIKNLN